VRPKPKWRHAQAMELAVIIRDFHRRYHRLLACRRAYDISVDALDIIFPKPPMAKKRGVRSKRA
jgi:hypothetical protein